MLNCHNLWFALVQSVQLLWLSHFVPPVRSALAASVHRANEPGCALHALAYPGLNVSATHATGRCYRRVIRLRFASGPPLSNRRHSHDDCPIPIVAAFRARLLGAFRLHNLTVTRRVCWIARGEAVPTEYAAMHAWHAARIVRGQAAFWARVGALSGTDARVLDFSDVSALPDMQTQLAETARCSLVVGMHGAGLNLAIAMERPRVLEVSRSHLANRNLQNLMTAIRGEYHGHVGAVRAGAIAARVMRIIGDESRR